MLREEIHTFFNEKEKYFISIILEKNIQNILINVRNNNESKITHQTVYNFDYIKENDIEFFYAFNGNIILLFKFLYRMLKANYYKLKKSKNSDIILTLYCFFNKTMKFINILIPKNDKIITDDDFFIEKEDLIINKPCAPVHKNNVFFYSNKTIYKIKITKKKSEIKFHIIEDNIINKIKGYESQEFLVKKNYDDFINLSHGYYSLFNGPLDDIYEDLLINFYNKNYKLRLSHSKMILSLYVFNFHKFNYSDIYLCINIYLESISNIRYKRRCKSIYPFKNKIYEIKEEKDNFIKKNEILIDEEEENAIDNFINEKENQKCEDSNINNFDEETDIYNSRNINNNSNNKENIEDLEVKCIEIKKENILIPGIPTIIPNKSSNEIIKIEESVKNNLILNKYNKFKVTKIEDKNENQEKILESNNSLTCFEKKNNSGLFVVDKFDNKKDININNQQNINYINSIIINYVQLNNPVSKRNGIYNFVINKIGNLNDKISEIKEINKDKKEDNNLTFNQINLVKENNEVKNKFFIKHNNYKFLTEKRKNNNRINELFKTTKENQKNE